MKDVTKYGNGWNRPRWKQILLWIRWRPYYWLKGQYKDKTIKFADRFGDIGPFRRVEWIALGKAKDYDGLGTIKEVHKKSSKCDCGSEYKNKEHIIILSKCPSYAFLGDDWWKKDDRLWSLTAKDK